MNQGLIYYVLDTETTGLLEKNVHEIFEYSIIRCSDKVQLTRQIRVDNPRNASADALMVTGKTIEDLKQGIGKKQAVREFNAFLEQDGGTPAHRCICAHHAMFDRKFCHFLWKQQGVDFLADYWLDTIPWCKRLAAQMGQPKAKVKLEMAMDLFGLKKYAGSHSASGDSRNLFKLWSHLMDAKIPYIDLIKPFIQRTLPPDVEDMLEID